MSELARGSRTVRFIGGSGRVAVAVAILAMSAGAHAGAAAAAPEPAADELIGIWAQELDFPPALEGELVIRREGERWDASLAGADAPCDVNGERITCTFSDGRGKYRGRVSGEGHAIDGWWLRPSGETTDRRDPGGSGQPFATLARLQPAGGGAWRGKVEPLPDRLSLYLHVFRNAGELEDVESGALVAVFRNPELNAIGGASYYNVRRDGGRVAFLREVPDAPEIRYDAVLADSPQRLRIRWPDVGALELSRRSPPQAAGALPRPPGEPAYAYRRPEDIGDGWTTANARDTGMDESALTRTVRGIIEANPWSRRPSLIHSMLVAHRGKLVLEEYFYGYDRDTPHDTRSAGKTFSSVMLGAAMLRGVDISPQSRIYEMLADLGPFANPDPRKQQITLAHLMTHSSGLDCDDNDDASLGNENTMTTQRQQPDWWKYALDLAQEHDPGTRYAYCSANTNLVGGALTKATGTWLPQLFEETVAGPLQFRRYHWPITPTEEGYQAGGAFVLPRDMLKVGQTYLDGGVWNGRRIVSEAWVEESTAPRIAITPATTGLSAEEFGNSYAEGADAYTWHLSELRSGGRTYREYDASGNGGQLIIVVPEADLVVVFTGGNYLQGGIWGRWRHTIVADQLIPAIRR
jgi:CubicO group peptidase (beta-lactamase class C family)